MSELTSALEGLLSHPGWHLFAQEAKKRWGPEGYARELKRAVTTAIEHHESAEAAIRAVDLANSEINSLLSWPKDVLRQHQDTEERERRGPLVSRRGPNL